MDGPQGFNNVADALVEAQNATSPADTVRFLYAAIRLQQQQIQALELGIGMPLSDEGGKALDGIRVRAKETEHTLQRMRVAGNGNA